MNLTKNNMANLPNRYTFDEAQVRTLQTIFSTLTIAFISQDHIFNLMNRDTYARFLRSEAYKELLAGGKKKVGDLFLHHSMELYLMISISWSNMCKSKFTYCLSDNLIWARKSFECNSQNNLFLVISCESAVNF